MQALVYTDTQTLIYKEEKNPNLKNGESIIKVFASGICGSCSAPKIILLT